MPRKHIIVRGRVQGVGFRYFTHAEAAAHGVSGWVRNRRDGTVEIEAEGDGPALEGFVEAVRRGPAFSSVISLDIDDQPETGGAMGFDMRY